MKSIGRFIRKVLSAIGWVLSVVAKAIWQVARWVGALPGRFWRYLKRVGWWRRITAVAVAGIAFLLVIAILGIAVWLGPHMPEYAAIGSDVPSEPVAYPEIDEVVYLRPGIRTFSLAPEDATLPEQIIEERTAQGWTDKERTIYYHTAQGSGQVILGEMRYDWFTSLELPFSRAKYASPSNLRRYGFIVDPESTSREANPGNLPVGFARYYDEKHSAEMLDLTCSLCHTGELHFTDPANENYTVAVRIDGGQAMHALTSMQTGQFQSELAVSMLLTRYWPSKFDRFAQAVMEARGISNPAAQPDYQERKAQLKSAFGQSLGKLLRQAVFEIRNEVYPMLEGYGRIDATQRIANTVFGRGVDPDNYRPAQAPVSYPYTWDIGKFDWVQYEGYASQPLARNINEALGVGARIDLYDDMGLALPLQDRFRTSVIPENLHLIEKTLAKLEAPAWPEKLFGSIDRVKASRGRARFDVHCRKCHGPHRTAIPPTAEAIEDPANGLLNHIWYAEDGTCRLVAERYDLDLSAKQCRASPRDVAEENGVDTSLYSPDDQWHARLDTSGRCELLRTDVPLNAQQCLNLQNPQRLTDIDGQPLYDVLREGGDTGEVIGVRLCNDDLNSGKKCSEKAGEGVEEWRINAVPLVAIGTDRTAAEQLMNNVYDASRLGLTSRILEDLCLPDSFTDSFRDDREKKLNAVEGLNIMSLAITRRYFEDHPVGSLELLNSMIGFGIQDYPLTAQSELNGYKPRPLHGVWATPPFLHNGSVRTIFQLLSPMHEREDAFWVGTKEYDHVDLGYKNLQVEGAVLQKAADIGNGNYGHNFDYGCEKFGVIGPYLPPAARREIIEYLKVMDYVDDDQYETVLNVELVTELKAELKDEHPPYDTPGFWASDQGHCSYEDSIYGHASNTMKTYAFEQSWDLSERCGSESYPVVGGQQ
jgi:hypothetical protein